jgi:hypothetical protein
MPVGLSSEEEVSVVWFNLLDPSTTSLNSSVLVVGSFVTCAVSVSSDSSIPFLPDVGWCFPVDDSEDEDSCISVFSGSLSWVSIVWV